MTSERSKILIVEDSPTMTRLYRMVLGSDPGRELLFATNGHEGLDLAATEEDVALFIVDINMPRMDGLEFLRRLRGELDRAAPALVVSTEAEEADRRAALAAGATAFLSKPLTPEELSRQVAGLLAGEPA